MRSLSLLYILFAALASTVASEDKTPKVKVSTIWTFPVGTWIENLVVRQNGQILATSPTHPFVYQVDPAGKKPATIAAEFPGNHTSLGITETTKDVFYIVAINGTVVSTGPITSSVWKLDVSKFTGGRPVPISRVARFPDVGVFNGITTVDAERGILLIADSTSGAVWRLNVNTGAKKKLRSNPLLQVKTRLGVNGIKVRGDNLYWTNTDQQIVATAPISAAGDFTGPAKIVANVTGPDDFIVAAGTNSAKATGFVAGSDMIQQFDGEAVSVLSNSTLLAGSTACRLSRSSHPDLYVSTTGGDAQYFAMNVTQPGKVVKISFE